MRWPWVSRKRLDRAVRKRNQYKANWLLARRANRDLAKRLRELEVELLRVPNRTGNSDADPEETAAPVQFTTPMDRLENRFTAAVKAGEPLPASARARIH